MDLGIVDRAPRLGRAAPRAEHAAARRRPRVHRRASAARADRGDAMTRRRDSRPRRRLRRRRSPRSRSTARRCCPGFDFGDTGSFQAMVGSRADHAARRLSAVFRDRPAVPLARRGAEPAHALNLASAIDGGARLRPARARRRRAVGIGWRRASARRCSSPRPTRSGARRSSPRSTRCTSRWSR